MQHRDSQRHGRAVDYDGVPYDTNGIIVRTPGIPASIFSQGSAASRLVLPLTRSSVAACVTLGTLGYRQSGGY